MRSWAARRSQALQAPEGAPTPKWGRLVSFVIIAVVVEVETVPDEQKQPLLAAVVLA